MTTQPQSDREAALEKLLEDAQQYPGVREAQELHEAALKAMGYEIPTPPTPIIATDRTNPRADASLRATSHAMS